MTPPARDLAAIGVRVVTIAPGTFLTPAMEARRNRCSTTASMQPFPSGSGTRRVRDARRADRDNPMINGETIRIDGAVRFRASPPADCVSCPTTFVDAGSLLGGGEALLAARRRRVRGGPSGRRPRCWRGARVGGADDRGVHVGVAESEAQHELHRAMSSRGRRDRPPPSGHDASTIGRQNSGSSPTSRRRRPGHHVPRRHG